MSTTRDNKIISALSLAVVVVIIILGSSGGGL